MLDTPQKVIDRARGLAYVSSSQYSDAKALEDYNIVRQLLSNTIMQDVNEAFFTTNITTDSVVGQIEYTLTDTVNSIDVNKIAKAYIKYTTSGEYVEATLSDVVSTNKESPTYKFMGDSIKITPAADVIVTDGIKLEASLTPVELTISATDTLFPAEYTSVIALGMLPMIYQRRGLIQESNNAERTFQNAITDMILNLSDRVSNPQEFVMPAELDYYA